MKRHISLLVVAALLQGAAMAQTEKGSFLVGPANLLELGAMEWRFSSPSGDGDPSTDKELGISVMAGYFIFDRLAVGISPSYHYRYVDFGDSEFGTTRNFAAKVFSRYYIGNGRFKPFAHAGAGPAYRNSTSEAAAATLEGSDVYPEYDVGGGLSYFIGDRVSLDLYAIYSIHKIRMDFTVDGQPYGSPIGDANDGHFRAMGTLLFYFGHKDAE